MVNKDEIPKEIDKSNLGMEYGYRSGVQEEEI